MLAPRSKKEIVLLVAVALYAVAPIVALGWGAWVARSPVIWLTGLGTPILTLAYVSLFGLWRRRTFGAWACLIFFLIQSLKVTRLGEMVWPHGYSFGLNVAVVNQPDLIIDVVVSSIVLAIVAARILVQYRFERHMTEQRAVTPL